MMFTNIAYYLKYRPKNLDELIGQEGVKKTLLSAYQNNKLSHAYLFVGPRGTGKTSTARILAKMVNCERSSVVRRQTSDKTSLKADSEASLKTDSYIPCNKCSTCISISDGSNLDLIEIDAASNRGIEDIRSLRDKIKLAPTLAKKKVYIIDEVHMLTTEAFNALLKTLEEPPAHALFILATTEVGKIPQTILSRAQRLDFKLASTEQLLAVLQKIVMLEKIEIDDEALKLLVKKSDGSFRDGVKLLDQASVLKGKITAKTLEESLKVTQFDDLLELIRSLAERNTNKGLLHIAKQVEGGIDTKELILSLMDILRNLLLIRNGLGEQLVKPNLTEDKYQQLLKVSENFESLDLVRNLDILQTSLEKLKFASIPSLPLELAIVEICTHAEHDPPASKQVSTSTTLNPAESEIRQRRQAFEAVSPQVFDSEAQTRGAESVQDNGSPDILKIKEKWTYVCETIRPYNFSLEALLRSTNVTECTDTEVLMEVPYSFHQRILEAPKNRDLLESILSDILGRSIRISTILGSRPKRGEDIANIEVAADDEIIRAAAEIFNSDTVN